MCTKASFATRTQSRTPTSVARLAALETIRSIEGNTACLSCQTRIKISLSKKVKQSLFFVLGHDSVPDKGYRGVKDTHCGEEVGDRDTHDEVN